LGEINLAGGDYTVEFHPTQWVLPGEILHLADVRLIPLGAVEASADDASADFTKLGLDADPEVAALSAQAKAAQNADSAADRLVRTMDFAKVHDYSEFLKYDRAVRDQEGLEAAAVAMVVRLRDLRDAKLAADPESATKLGPDGFAKLQSYLAAVATARDDETRPCPKGQVAPPGRRDAEPKPLFPTGHFEDLPRQPISENLPTTELPTIAAPDAGARMARFQERDTDAGIEALCRELYRVVHPEATGLEKFDNLYQAKQFRAALDAFREYFFQKLVHPEKYGADTTNMCFGLAAERGKGELLFYPSAYAARLNMNGYAVGLIGHQQVSAKIGPPGAVYWAPSDLAPPRGVDTSPTSPFWKTPAGQTLNLKTQLFQYLHYFPSDGAQYTGVGFFNALLFTYATGGDKSYLDRWCQYLDDYCLNGKTDQENCLVDVRHATELEPSEIRASFTLFRIILDERPEFATDVDSATLARFLMLLVRDYPPYTIRARRAEMANWGIMAVAELDDDARFLSEFKAMDYLRQEDWRLWNSNMIQHRTLDGEDVEAWDSGHNAVDIGFADSVNHARLPDWVTPWDLADFWDQIKVNERSLLTHIQPDGDYWPADNAAPATFHDLPGRWLADGCLDLVAGEPSAKARIDAILGQGATNAPDLPDRTSDLAPYAAMSYLRDGWGPDAEQLTFTNFGPRSQGLKGVGRTMYTVSCAGRLLLEANSLAVDGKPDNRFYGQIHTGGKTEFAGSAGRHVYPTRFLTSDLFDFTEGVQDNPYAKPRFAGPADPFGLYAPTGTGQDDPAPVTDVTDDRQVFSVKGEGLYLVSDRIHNVSGTPHQYTQCFLLPVRLPEAGVADRVRVLSAAGYKLVEEDPAKASFRTANPGFGNVSVFCIRNGELDCANRFDPHGNLVTIAKDPLQLFQDALKFGDKYLPLMSVLGHRPVCISWTAPGDQVFVTALATRPASDNLSAPFAGDVNSIAPANGADGVTGCQGTTHSGSQFWFQSGPGPGSNLKCGPVTAKAESLLVVKKTSGRTAGVVLGCASMKVGGVPSTVSAADFEFEVTGTGALQMLRRIERPIDTTVISPPQDVFTDKVTVSFAIPNQDTRDLQFRYTLDGSDPTLTSKLYTGPFDLTSTSFVKVRPFRRGLTDTPWEDDGTDSGRVVAAIFRKTELAAASPAPEAAPGLRYSYFEGDWPTLFTYAGVPGALDPKATGTTSELLDPAELDSVRKTDRAFAVRYEGLVRVPADGVYTFYAPAPLYTPAMDAGYDLRVFVDGTEWFPSPRLHGENTWSIALATGYHRFMVSYVDYRWKNFKNDYWMAWQPEEMWQGVPILAVSGPGLAKGPLPKAWLAYEPQNSVPSAP